VREIVGKAAGLVRCRCRFADRVCLVFGHLEAIALELGIQKLTIDVE